MKSSEIREKLAAAHSVLGVPARVKSIRSGSLAGGWQYQKFRPCYGFARQPWLYAGKTEEVARWLS